MKALYAAVTEAREAGTGRRLCDLFMVKPSKKDYPDYFKIIQEPLDMRTIEHNIRTERYNNEDALMDDLKLMFRNARHYNEEGSQVGILTGILHNAEGGILCEGQTNTECVILKCTWNAGGKFYVRAKPKLNLLFKKPCGCLNPANIGKS